MKLALLLLVPALLAQKEQEIQAHYRQAQEALSRNQYAAAAEQFQAMLRLNPNLAEAHANLGTIYYAQGKYADASAAFRKALQLKPALAGAETFLGLSEAAQGRLGEAVPHLEKGFWKSSSDEWRLKAGLLLTHAYWGSQDLDQALDVVQALERAYPGNDEVLYAAYRLHSALGAKAVAALVKAAPGSARLHLLTAELLESEGDYPKAVEQYRQALKIDPNLAGAHRALGVALMHSATDEATRMEAQQQFEAELTLNSTDAPAEYQLGEICWLKNQPEEALKHFSRAVELQPNFIEALIAAGKVWTARGQPQQAVNFLERAIAIDAENEVAHYRLAQAYLKMGNKPRSDQELAEFRRLRAALESLRTIYRQVQERRVTAQTVD